MKNFDPFNEKGDVIWNIANLLRSLYRPLNTGESWFHSTEVA
jgi:hypothetical protein